VNRYPLFLLFVVSAAAYAADPKTCPAIEDATARLACYDAAFGRTSSAAKESTAESATEQFGMNDRLRREKSNGEERNTAPDEMGALISTAQRNTQGYYTLILDNGQRWYVTETTEFQSFRDGDRITIRRGAFGSYLLTHERGGRSLRVRRIE
jgi:hypothetical protein